MLTGLYVAGDSPVHRAPAGLKLLLLVAFSTVLVAGRSLGVAAACAATVAAVYLLAGLGPRLLLAQVWPLRWVLLLLVPFQWWTAGWRAALVVTGTLVVAVAAAGLVTLTTRVTQMLDALTAGLRPLQRLGIDPERVALLLSLTIRAIPVIAGTMAETRDARRARGLERSTRALLTPLVIRTIRHADRVGDALAARGLDD